MAGDAREEVATLVERPSKAETVTLALPEHQTSMAAKKSHAEAMAVIEIRRTKTFAAVGLATALFALVAMAILPSLSPMTPLMLVAIALACVSMAYLIYRTSRPATFHDGPLIALARCGPAL